MDTDVGVVRNQAGLELATTNLSALLRETAGTPAEDPVALSLLIARAALRRKENRGAHFRSDGEPQTEPAEHSASRWEELTSLF
jgi:L-aspartate oxidase